MIVRFSLFHTSFRIGKFKSLRITLIIDPGLYIRAVQAPLILSWPQLPVRTPIIWIGQIPILQFS